MVEIRDLKEHVRLAPYTTMHIGGPARYFVVARSLGELRAAGDWAATQQVPVFVLGEGSNIVVSEDPAPRLVVKLEMRGFEVLGEDEASATIRVGAGEHWDDVVQRSVEMGLSGIEAMSKIPGTAGAAPVQNAGAYGQEIADTLVEIEAYDLQQRALVTLPRTKCGFSYRASNFKGPGGKWAGRYAIVSVTLKLSKRPPAEVTYASLRRYLDEHDLNHPSVAQIREAVTAIRARILPDPSVVPNSGSFFKNPMVDAQTLADLKARFPGLPSFAYGDKFKLSAGWILDQCGFKGAEHFGLRLWANHALVITNPNNAEYVDLVKLVELMVGTVEEKFGITLAPEPEFIS